MPRLKLTLQYDGTAFVGWQVQANGRSIQETVQGAFETIRLGRVPVTGASRTDAGVHATGQVCHVDVPEDAPDLRRLHRSLNGVLPRDIRVQQVERAAPDFHARYAATSKEYRYLVAPAREVPPLLQRAVWHHPAPLEVDRMCAAATALVGTHDFAAFQAAGSDVTETVRTMYSADFVDAHYPGLTAEDGALLAFDIRGSGFLYKMVRAIVGTLIDIGTGRLEPNALPAILAGHDRNRAGQTAPARGLCLCRVRYDAPQAPTGR